MGLWRSFSTLKPGRTSATHDRLHQRLQRLELSVPSNRVEPLQLKLSALLMLIKPAFSTLKPGRTSATYPRPPELEDYLIFQYPQTGPNISNQPTNVWPPA